MQDRGAREEYVACPSRLLIKEICSTWHLMRQVDYQLVLYRFLPVCHMQVEFLRKLCYVKIQSAWIHSRSGNRFRDHVATKTLHDTCIFIPYVRCAFYIRFRVRGNFPVIFQAHVFFSQRNPRTATRSGPFTASCVSEMQLEFFPQGQPKQVFSPPWTGGQVWFGGRENSQPGFCALFLWAPGNVRLKCARNPLCTFFLKNLLPFQTLKVFLMPNF